MVAAGALAALTAAYLAQTVSPLRLTGDSIGYLEIASSIADGHGIPRGADLPPGLPALYALLDVAGVGTGFGFVAMNCFFLAVAIACALYVYRRTFGFTRQTGMVLAAIVLLSYVVVKHAALALSDIPFLGLTYAALAALTAAHSRGSSSRWAALAAGALLSAAAIAVRTAAIALVPVWIWTMVSLLRAEGPPGTRSSRRRSRAAEVAVCAAVIAAAAVSVSHSRYFGRISAAYGGAGPGRSAAFVLDHLENWGEVAVNVPRTRIPGPLEVLLAPVGILTLIVLLLGVWRVRRPLQPAHVFTIAYLILILPWPYEDARFWLPVVPLAVAYAYVALRPLLRWRVCAVAVSVYLGTFCLLGAAALALSTRISYSGNRFPSLYGSGGDDATLRPTYRVAFGVARAGDGARVNARALAVLRRYEPRARRHHTRHGRQPPAAGRTP